MKTKPTYTRDQLIAWCKERSSANRNFKGNLTMPMLRSINYEWPHYFDAVAEMLDQDGPRPTETT